MMIGGTSTATSTYYDTGTAVLDSAYVQFTTSSGGTTNSIMTDSTARIVRFIDRIPSLDELMKGKTNFIDFETKVKLKDGSIISIDAKGNFVVNDKNAKVIYKGNRIKEFNRYINASNILEEFIQFLGDHYNAKQSDVLKVPLELFINFLIIRASQEDGDEFDDQLKKLNNGIQKNYLNRCGWCGKFIPKKLISAGIQFCNLEHYQRRLNSIT